MSLGRGAEVEELGERLGQGRGAEAQVAGEKVGQRERGGVRGEGEGGLLVFPFSGLPGAGCHTWSPLAFEAVRWAPGLLSGGDPSLPCAVSRLCSEPVGFEGHSRRVLGARSSGNECLSCAAPCTAPVLLVAWMEWGITMQVGAQGRWEGHRLLLVLLVN